MHSSVAIGTFTLSCSHPHHPSPELSHLHKLKLCPHETLPIPSPSPWPPPTIFCLYGFDSSRTSYEWDQTVFVLPCLAYFIQHPLKKPRPHEQSPHPPPPAPDNQESTLSLWICLFWMFPFNGITPCVSFCVWLLSLSILFSGSINIVASVSASLLFMAE